MVSPLALLAATIRSSTHVILMCTARLRRSGTGREWRGGIQKLRLPLPSFMVMSNMKVSAPAVQSALRDPCS